MIIAISALLAFHPGPDLASAPRAVPIVGGSPTSDSEFDGVVALLLPSDRTCSGIVVAPRLVMTAAHCVAELATTDQIRVAYGDDANGPSFLASGFGYDAARYCPTCNEDRYDVAWVELGQDFPSGAAFPKPIATDAEWSEVVGSGTIVTVAGFGATMPGVQPDGIKRAVSMEITKLSDAGLEFYAGGDGRDSCGGDSGGPALTHLADGALRLIGLTSRGPEECGSGGIYATPYPQLCTMREQTGVDLTAPGCEQCDCVDFDDGDGGCNIGGSASWGWLVVLCSLALNRRAAAR